MKVSAARESLSGSLGRDPTLEELAGALGTSKEEVAASLEAGAQVESIYAPSGAGEDHDLLLLDRLAQEKGENEDVLDRMVLGELLRALGKKERDYREALFLQPDPDPDPGDLLGADVEDGKKDLERDAGETLKSERL